MYDYLSYSRLLILKVLLKDFQNCLNNNNMKNKQEKLLRIQLLKINYIIENHKQNNENDNDSSIS